VATPKKKNPKKRGQKGKYHKWLKPENLLTLQAWKRDGLTDAQIAKNVGISTVTLYDWINKYPNIANVLKIGKEQAVTELENAMFKAARGYKYEEQVMSASGKVETVQRWQAANATSGIFLLKNWAPNRYSDRKEITATTEVTVKNPMKDLTTDELRKLAVMEESQHSTILQ